MLTAFGLLVRFRRCHLSSPGATRYRCAACRALLCVDGPPASASELPHRVTQGKGDESGQISSTIHNPAFAVSATVAHVTFSPETIRKKRLFLDPFSYPARRASATGAAIHLPDHPPSCAGSPAHEAAARPLVPPLWLGALQTGDADVRQEEGRSTPRTLARATPRGASPRGVSPRGAGLVSPCLQEEFMRDWMLEMEGADHADQMLAAWRMKSARKASPIAIPAAESELFDWVSSASSLSSKSSDESLDFFDSGGTESPVGACTASSGTREGAKIGPEWEVQTAHAKNADSRNASAGEGLDREGVSVPWSVRESRPEPIAKVIAAQSPRPRSPSSQQLSPFASASPHMQFKCQVPPRGASIPVLNLGQLRRAEDHAQAREHRVVGETTGTLPLDLKLPKSSGHETRHTEAGVSAAEAASPNSAGLPRSQISFSSPADDGAGYSTWMPMSARGTSWTGDGLARRTWDGAALSSPMPITARWDSRARALTPRDRQISQHRWQGAIKLQQHVRRALKQRGYAALKIKARDDALKRRCLRLSVCLCSRCDLKAEIHCNKGIGVSCGLMPIRCRSDRYGTVHCTWQVCAAGASVHAAHRTQCEPFSNSYDCVRKPDCGTMEYAKAFVCN